jgi:Polyketide cyclase / dehydrase and lipid transport
MVEPIRAAMSHPFSRRYYRIMAQPLVVEQSRAIPVGQEDAFREMVPIPLDKLFHRWYGPIPPIKEVRGQTGDWDAVGQTRTVVLVGGGSMVEELTHFDPPRSFGYTLTDIKGPLAPLVGRVEGEWTFDQAGTGTNVTWRWTIHPRSALTAPMLPVFGRLWRGYARESLEELSSQLVR